MYSPVSAPQGITILVLDQSVDLLVNRANDILSDIQTVSSSFENALNSLSSTSAEEEEIREDIETISEEAADIVEMVNDYDDIIKERTEGFQLYLVVSISSTYSG